MRDQDCEMARGGCATQTNALEHLRIARLLDAHGDVIAAICAYREVAREGPRAAAAEALRGSTALARHALSAAGARLRDPPGVAARLARRGRVHGGEQLVVEGLGPGDPVEHLHPVAARQLDLDVAGADEPVAEWPVDHRVLDAIERDRLRGPREDSAFHDDPPVGQVIGGKAPAKDPEPRPEHRPDDEHQADDVLDSGDRDRADLVAGSLALRTIATTMTTIAPEHVAGKHRPVLPDQRDRPLPRHQLRRHCLTSIEPLDCVRVTDRGTG